MSDNAIRVGDLVCVVRGHVCELGRVFIVSEISTLGLPLRCSICECHIEPTTSFCRDGQIGKFGHKGAPLSWLRRIPPLSELDEAERKEEEPA